jgi:opine dehydrogenase
MDAFHSFFCPRGINIRRRESIERRYVYMNAGIREDIKFAVVGAGNSGCAMAAHLALMGFKVNLYNRSEYRLKDIKKTGGIHLEGAVSGFGRLDKITTDIEEAIRDVDIIMITTPATGHRNVAKMAAPFLQEDQIIVLNPGRTGGALEFKNIIKQTGVRKEVIISEAQTFIYACRIVGPARVKIFSIKDRVDVAAIPAYKTRKVVEKLSCAYPQFHAAESVLETSLNNIGAIFHPAPTLLNSARIETTEGDFQYYIDGISPAVASVIEKIDRERIKVANALKVKAVSALEWLKFTYGSEGNSLYEAIQNTKAYKGLKAPDTVHVRYIFEDVPESLVPIASFGRIAGVPTPVIDSVIEMASAMHNINYWEKGRTAEKLGLKGLSVDQIHQLVLEGEVVIPQRGIAEGEAQGAEGDVVA